MTEILYIKSHLNPDSTCNKIANLFISEYKKDNPHINISEFDLNNEKVGKISLNSENFPHFWQDVNADFWIEKLKTVKKVIISSPIINWGYSAQIKNFFDAICLADRTFSYKYAKKGGSIGLLDNIENVQIILSAHSKQEDFVNPSPVETIAGTFNFLGAKKINTPLVIEESHKYKGANFDEKLIGYIKKIAKSF
ncbi:FMN-dependent NADH-azoreductase [Mycoplasma flocculare]|uniref:FMN-dependent NADH-azoreductase n=1 Tax=Mesomycoplasma flocculare TaxID=2128 RepID=A0AAW9XCK3_MESFC|nr:FMN-dependent NADH-azoreductase [Mesomycoplasma flocculare]MXR39411.1 FMN-dependent NADH-azoreductase [Mycoplasma sp. MF12]MXR55915.1 FMN-dependent NADH-azoreductase [Mesomycoplasma flocculare]MXR56398.1 FMN-dependent NADH-azoreductase [Mesomycoplasma flocculare]